MRDQLAYDARCYLVLKLEDVLQFAIEPISPDVSPRSAIDQLTRDPHSPGRLAHTAFEHITNPQFATHLLDVNRLALVGERRVASDNKKRFEARQRGDDVFHHAISEILLLDVAAHVLEREH